MKNSISLFILAFVFIGCNSQPVIHKVSYVWVIGQDTIGSLDIPQGYTLTDDTIKEIPVKTISYPNSYSIILARNLPRGFYLRDTIVCKGYLIDTMNQTFFPPTKQHSLLYGRRTDNDRLWSQNTKVFYNGLKVTILATSFEKKDNDAINDIFLFFRPYIPYDSIRSFLNNTSFVPRRTEISGFYVAVNRFSNSKEKIFSGVVLNPDLSYEEKNLFTPLNGQNKLLTYSINRNHLFVKQKLSDSKSAMNTLQEEYSPHYQFFKFKGLMYLVRDEIVEKFAESVILNGGIPLIIDQPIEVAYLKLEKNDTTESAP